MSRFYSGEQWSLLWCSFLFCQFTTLTNGLPAPQTQLQRQQQHRPLVPAAAARPCVNRVLLSHCPAAAQYEQDYLPKRLGNWQVNPNIDAKVNPATSLLGINC